MEEKNRILYLDILRIIAAAMVVMIHVGGMFTMSSSSPLPFIEILKALSACAVPVFFMISGALFLRPDYEISIKKIVIKIAKVVVLVLVWNFISTLVTADHISLGALVKGTIKGHFHMWFFDYYIGVLLLLPVLKAFVEYRDGKFVPFYLIACFLLSSAVFTIARFGMYLEEIWIFTSKIHIEMVNFCGYMILGYWLSISKRTFNSILLGLGTLAMGLSIVAIALKTEIVYSTLSFTTFVLAESTFVFLLVKQAMAGKVADFSAAGYLSMGIYLIHPLIFENLPEQWWTKPWLMIFVYPMVILGSALLAYIIRKIPHIGKQLLSI